MERAVIVHPVEQQHRVRRSFLGLDEKHRRRRAAMDAERLARGGIHSSAGFLHSDRKSIRRGCDGSCCPTIPRAKRPGVPAVVVKEKRRVTLLPGDHRRVHRR